MPFSIRALFIGLLFLPLHLQSLVHIQAQVQAQENQPDPSFYKKADLFFGQVVKGQQVDYQSIKNDPSRLLELMMVVDNADVKDLTSPEQLAFYINAYNLTVIKAIILNYPIKSTNEIPGFFDVEKHKIGGAYMTLNDLENKLIRPTFKDPRIHFVLVCGAKGCPPIINKAYHPETLEEQLELQAKMALNDGNFIKELSGGDVGLSKIFDWYQKDFAGNEKGVLSYINKYRDAALKNGAKVSYYPYNWSLNDSGDPFVAAPTTAAGLPAINPNRYIVSALYKKGQYELNLFNNLYYEKSKSDANTADFTNSATFFTPLFQFLMGINPRLNVGADLRFRSVNGSFGELVGIGEALKFPSTAQVGTDSTFYYSRLGLTAFGPKIKYAPFRNFGNISVQHTLYFPLGKDLGGNEDMGYIDWDGFQFWTQFFFDQPIGDQFAIFVEVDLNLENVNFDLYAKTGGYMQVSTPMTIIPSWFPNDEVTVYGLIGSAPRWGVNVVEKELLPDGGERFNSSYDPFSQFGLGFKYLFANKLQLEVLYTNFHKNSLTRAATYNFGIRYIVR